MMLFFINRGFIMIKYIFTLIIALFMMASSSASAGLITTDLTEDTYISYGGYDWTWASPVNVTNYVINDFQNGQRTNEFKDADFHAGWMEIVNSANNPDLESLFLDLELSDFIDVNNVIISSVSYWNTLFTDVDVTQFNERLGKKNDQGDDQFFNYETFYVRASNTQAPATVPEPTTLFIFAASLAGFALRQRKTK